VYHLLRLFLVGLIAILPALVTILVTSWVLSTIYTYVGPTSRLGAGFVALGLVISGSSTGAYLLGICIVILFVLAVGLVVEARVLPWAATVFEAALSRIPVVSNIYDISKRFVSVVDRRSGDDLKSMAPVWCFFGGDGGAAVLALMPSQKPVAIGGGAYLAILVPSAPVPFGGALIYVPQSWVKPASGGVDRLVSVYVSMGVTPPDDGAAGS
jgi:uncharacterized membrane protein